MFSIALFDGDSLNLAVGRGPIDAVRDHGEDDKTDNAREIYALARSKFQIDEEEITVDGKRELSDWLGSD